MEKENAYVINLKHRPDRWDNMIERFGKLNLIRVDGIVLPDDGTYKSKAKGLAMTHMKFLRECKEKGMKTVLLLEDDCVPEPGWYNRWISIKEHLDRNLDTWDVFNGCVHFLWDKKHINTIDETYLLTGSVGCASHWMYFNLESFDKLIQWTDEDIDMFYNDGKRFKLLTCFPFIAIQDDGHSDIMNETRNWSMTYFRNRMENQMFINSIIDG